MSLDFFFKKTCIALITFIFFSQALAQNEISLAKFIERIQEFNADVGSERCNCESIMNSISLMQEIHATKLPQINRKSANAYMDKLVFNSPKFAPCFDGKKDLGPSCGVCPKTTGSSALVVMDMQRIFTDRNGAIRTSPNKSIVDAVIAEQLKAIEKAKQSTNYDS